MTRKDKKSFLLYGSYETQFDLLSMTERGELITAIFEYERTGTAPAELSPLVGMAFSFIRDALDRDRQSYENYCAQQSEKGKKGGRPKKTATTYEAVEKDEEKAEEKTYGFFEKAIYDNDNGNDNENDNDNAIGEEKKKEKETIGVSVSDSAPRSVAPPPIGPRLSDKEKSYLSEYGIPIPYAEERITRAREYSTARRTPVEQVLTKWWQEDSPVPRARNRPYLGISRPKSYDVDDFFQAALSRSYA